jgi:hypothetical protein
MRSIIVAMSCVLVLTAVPQVAVGEILDILPIEEVQEIEQPQARKVGFAKGMVVLLGGLDLAYSRHSNRDGASGTEFSISIGPVFEYLLSDMFALGIGASAAYHYLDLSGLGSEGFGRLEVGPRMSFYIPTGGTARPYFSFQIGLTHTFIMDDDDGTGVHVAPELGVAFPLKEGLFMKVGLGYQFRYQAFPGNDLFSHTLPFRIGFGALL